MEFITANTTDLQGSEAVSRAGEAALCAKLTKGPWRGRQSDVRPQSRARRHGKIIEALEGSDNGFLLPPASAEGTASATRPWWLFTPSLASRWWR